LTLKKKLYRKLLNSTCKEGGKPKSQKHKTRITRSYLHAKIVAVTMM